MRIIDNPTLKQALIDGAPYDITVTVTPSGGGTPVVIDSAHIAENGIVINPSAVTGNRLELGTVVAAVADFTFYNYDGTLDGIAFKGATLYVQGIASVNGSQLSFDIGYFIADDVTTHGPRISVACFDRMILLDKVADPTRFAMPMSVYMIAYYSCAACGIYLDAEDYAHPNYDYVVDAFPAGSPTYRQLLAWAAQIMGCCAKVNNKGNMNLVWYESAADWQAGLNNRFEGGEIAESPVTLTGVKVKRAGATAFLAGAEGYTLDILDNGLLQTIDAATINGIWTKIGAFSYYPATCAVIQNVLAEPFDVIDYEMEDGTARTVAVTDVVYNISARTAIESKGISTEEAGYAQQDAFTPEQNGALCDAGRLKIGRVESNDGRVYFDLDNGVIHTQNETERVTGASSKSTYETDMDFAEGELAFILQKDGVEIGRVEIGVNGINVTMDETQGYSFPKPANWDSLPAVAKAAWWTGQRFVASAFNSDNVVNNSLTVTDKDKSAGIKQANVSSQNIQTKNLDTTNLKGDLTQIVPDGLEVQKLSYAPGSADWAADKSEYKYDHASVAGTIAALTGIKIGSANYNDPNAKQVATEEYADNAVQKLIAGTLLTGGADLDLLDNGVWCCNSAALAASIQHIPPTDASPVGAFTVAQYGADDSESQYGIQIFITNPTYFLAEIFIRHRGETEGWQSWQKITGEIKPTNWKQVQEIVRAGIAQQVFSVGDQLTSEKNGVSVVWDVIGFDHDVPVESGLTHSMTLQMHSIYKGLQFDAKEAFYYAADGLAAGTYNLTIGAHSWVPGDVNKTVQFTLSNAVPAGGQIVFNQGTTQSCVGSTISTYASATSKTIIETVTMTEGSGGTSLGTIYNTKQTYLNSMQRALAGNNNYKESAIRQLLNSSAAAGSVWTPQNVWDRPPDWISTEAGFMNDIDEDFVAVVGEVSKITARNTLCDGGGSDTTADVFFLLSREEIYGGQENNIDEGGAYEYYSKYSDLSSPGLTSPDANRVKYQNGTARTWWLRTPIAGDARYARYITTTGTGSGGNAAGPFAVCPACNIV